MQGNYAFSGGIKGIEAVESKEKAFKARMTKCLVIAGAFHTSFMEPIVSKLEATLASTDIRTQRIPIISNVKAQHWHDRNAGDTCLYPIHRTEWEIIALLMKLVGYFPCSMGNNNEDFIIQGLKKIYDLGPLSLVDVFS